MRNREKIRKMGKKKIIEKKETRNGGSSLMMKEFPRCLDKGRINKIGCHLLHDYLYHTAASYGLKFITPFSTDTASL